MYIETNWETKLQSQGFLDIIFGVEKFLYWISSSYSLYIKDVYKYPKERNTYMEYYYI